MSGGDIPADVDVEITPTVVSGPTDERPTTIRIQFKNTASSTREFQFGRPVPFEGDTDVQGPTILYLLDSEETGLNPLEENQHIPEERSGECWEILDGSLSYNAVGNRQSLGPGESVSNEYVILSGQGSRCPVEGTFEFTLEYPLPRDGQEHRTREWDLEVAFESVRTTSGRD